MRLSSLLWRLFVFLVYPAIISTIALYLYPAVLNCSFPLASRPEAQCLFEQNATNSSPKLGQIAPFRLLALGDPQLEGDSSLPDPDELSFPSLHGLHKLRHAESKFATARDITIQLVTVDIPTLARYYRKRLDLFGNDFYLAHIYRTLHWWTGPTHVAVLGDLIGSQWVSDGEFSWRSWRYWNRVFRHGQKVDEDTMSSSQTEALGQDLNWSRRLINVAGNHDIGYAGDINRARLDRFEREFGRVNWDIKFQLPRANLDASVPDMFSFGAPPSLRLVVLNNMNLDGPALDTTAQAETYQYMNDLITRRLQPVEDRTSAVILLTHIPLAKKDGVCVDGPYFSYRDSGIREQNHLSTTASEGILQGIYGKSNKFGAVAKGLGRNGIIVNGHDHEGCDVYHYTSPPPLRASEEGDGETATPEWEATPWYNATHLVEDTSVPGIREITLRSMMGSYGGYAGLLSAWFDEDEGQWRFEHAYCPLGIQHIWWAVHILDFVVLLLLAGVVISLVAEALASRPALASRRATHIARGEETGLRSMQRSKQSNAKAKRKKKAGSNLTGPATSFDSPDSSEIEVADEPRTPRRNKTGKKGSSRGSVRSKRDISVTPRVSSRSTRSNDTPAIAVNKDDTTPSKRGRGRPRKSK